MSLLVVVVSYRNSTSNHNLRQRTLPPSGVVSYRNSTSNHNDVRSNPLAVPLYLIEILHQTTTVRLAVDCLDRCILSKFYIKPQQLPYLLRVPVVVSYRNSTSNHNILILRSVSIMLYLIEILHQTTTGYCQCFRCRCCILSKFYIKPQLKLLPPVCLIVVSYRNSTSNHNAVYGSTQYCCVVSYRNSTSNHNAGLSAGGQVALYLIEILHQTTTPGRLFFFC